MASATAPVSASTRRRTLTELARDPRRTVLLAVVLMTFVTCIDVLHDPDVWWHLRLGQWIIDHHRLPGGELFSYTAAGKPFTAHEWFADVIFASVHAVGGMLAIAIVCALVSWSGLVALVLRARDRRVSPLVIAVGIAIGAKASQVVLGSRPQVATFALACWTLLIAERYLAAGGRRRWLLPPLFLLWANVHAGFL
ncbi:MAG TPA: hypothetical protein VE219_04240, partial [Candidatus Sulfotelmatobacter sp.]|nr:hypothetical protein [Candidatus Sulfotelmatobacter sp.]